MAALVFAIGAGEHLIGGNLQETQDKLRGWFTMPFMVIFGLFMALIIFGMLNIAAKRIDDIGLPGWLLIAGLVILVIIISYFVSDKASHGLNTLIWLALLFTPSNALLKK